MLQLRLRHEAFDEMVRHRVVRKLVGLMVTALVHRNLERASSRRGCNRWPMCGSSREVLVGFDAAASDLNKALKSFLFEKLYDITA